MHSFPMLPLQACPPPAGNGTCKVASHTLLLLLPAALHAALGLDHLAAQRDSARPTGDKLFSSKSLGRGRTRHEYLRTLLWDKAHLSVSTEVQP